VRERTLLSEWVCLRGLWEAGEEKRMSENEKYLYILCIYEDNITQCTISC
jgi:hypothetical protein